MTALVLELNDTNVLSSMIYSLFR